MTIQEQPFQKRNYIHTCSNWIVKCFLWENFTSTSKEKPQNYSDVNLVHLKNGKPTNLNANGGME